MENHDPRQGIAEQDCCPSYSSGEGRLAEGPPDPLTTLRWFEEQRRQDGVDSMVDDICRGQPSSHLGWATVSDVMVYQHVPCISTTSTVSVCRPADELQAFTRKGDVIRGTAKSSSCQQHELARNRAMYNDNQLFEPTYTSAEGDERHPDAIETSIRGAHDGVAYGLKDNWNKRQTQAVTTSTTGGRHEAMYSLSDNQHNTVVPAFAAASAAQNSTGSLH